MLEIYLDPVTVNSRKVLAGLDLLGTPYHFNHVDYFAGAHKSPEYMKINPHGTVPSAVDGELNITESNAILQYAADLGNSDGSIYYPKDLKKRAEVNRWLLWEASVWFPSCYAYLIEYVVKPLLKAEPDQALIDAGAPRWNELAGILDAQLARTKWLTGDEVSIADIAVGAPIHVHAAQRLPLEKYPNLKRWMEEGIEKLPCWQKTQGAVEKALLPGGGV
jgi:glutathione S-transferase